VSPDSRFFIQTHPVGVYYLFITPFHFRALQKENVAEIWLFTCLSIGMTNSEEKDWRKLCELAAKETDPEKLYALVEQLNRALEVRAHRMQGRTQGDGNRGPQASQGQREEGQA